MPLALEDRRQLADSLGRSLDAVEPAVCPEQNVIAERRPLAINSRGLAIVRRIGSFRVETTVVDMKVVIANLDRRWPGLDPLGSGLGLLDVAAAAENAAPTPPAAPSAPPRRPSDWRRSRRSSREPDPR